MTSDISDLYSGIYLPWERTLAAESSKIRAFKSPNFMREFMRELRYMGPLFHTHDSFDPQKIAEAHKFWYHFALHYTPEAKQFAESLMEETESESEENLLYLIPNEVIWFLDICSEIESFLDKIQLHYMYRYVESSLWQQVQPYDPRQFPRKIIYEPLYRHVILRAALKHYVGTRAILYEVPNTFDYIIFKRFKKDATEFYTNTAPSYLLYCSNAIRFRHYFDEAVGMPGNELKYVLFSLVGFVCERDLYENPGHSILLMATPQNSEGQRKLFLIDNEDITGKWNHDPLIQYLQMETKLLVERESSRENFFKYNEPLYGMVLAKMHREGSDRLHNASTIFDSNCQKAIEPVLNQCSWMCMYYAIAFIKRAEGEENFHVHMFRFLVDLFKLASTSSVRNFKTSLPEHLKDIRDVKRRRLQHTVEFEKAVRRLRQRKL